MIRHFNIIKLKAMVLTIVLACLAICVFAPKAHAEIITPDLDATCSLTLNLKTTDGDTAPGITLGIIRVAEPEVGDSGYYYELTEDFAATGASLDSIGTTESDLANAKAFALFAEDEGYSYTTAVTDADGAASFGALPCGLYMVNMVDAPEGYTLGSPFLVTLPQGDFDEGWTYDVVADAKPIELVYTEPTPDSVWVDPPVKKTVVGDTPDSDGTFTFTMKADDPSFPMPEGSDGDTKSITVKGAGSYEFGVITYTEPGTYTYTVTEKARGEKGYTYDGSTYTVTHEITKGETALEAKTTITKDGEPVDEIAFENKYTKDKPAGTTPAKKATKRLPQTGQIWLPVYVLAGVGLVLFGAGWYRSRRSDGK